MASIIDEKYKNRPKVQDFVSELIDSNCLVEGKIDVDRLFALAEANGVKTEHLEHHRDKKNGVGRLRMTIANSLRARARKRHGLYDLDGDVVDAPAEFIGDRPQVETIDGEKIKAQQPENSGSEAA